jgi:hypothetical protein
VRRTFGLVAKHVFLFAVVIATVVLLVVVGRGSELAVYLTPLCQTVQ